AHLRRAATQEAEKRRSSLGNVPTARHRASDAFLDPHHAAILFRDSRGVSGCVLNLESCICARRIAKWTPM
ncbi:jg1582, partial [Pararge aegeria aegeria]